MDNLSFRSNKGLINVLLSWLAELFHSLCIIDWSLDSKLGVDLFIDFPKLWHCLGFHAVYEMLSTQPNKVTYHIVLDHVIHHLLTMRGQSVSIGKLNLLCLGDDLN